MRVLEPKEYPAMKIAVPCDNCGAKETTVSFDGKNYQRIRLCADCLREGLALIEEVQE
jgi:hypothetical protein